MHGLLYFGGVKWAHLILSALFISFAIMQWNDPDALMWILMYIVVSAVAFFAFKGRHDIRVNAAIVAVLLVTLVFYIPDLSEWLKDGMPSIAESMQATSPYIELVRESLGLMISLITMLFYLYIAKRN